MTGDWQDAVRRARDHAPFLARALERQPELTTLLRDGDGEAALAFARQAGRDAPDVGAALRRERLALATALAIGDLAGAFPLTRVMEELSALADRALDAAIEEAIRRRAPDAQPAGFVAIALGKHGAGELNYSSDIDPILLYDPELLPRRSRDEPGEAAQNYARTVMELLSRQTGEGYVFRVDLRLRPASEVSPLAISVDAALSHYESSALAWERAAFIRSRTAAGDRAVGEGFLASIRPFVWRRSLDFTAIEEIRRLTARIRRAHGGPNEPGPGFDVKKGRGGIREVEFFAQTHQLIYGGRKSELRQRGTRAALDSLAEQGIIDRVDAQILGEAYDSLRTIEHRLQMVDDRQTHALPAGAALDNVARLDGMADGAALVARVKAICARVADRYDRLLAADGQSAPTISAAAAERFGDAVARWRDNIRALRSTEARAAFDAMLPDLLNALAQAPDPDHALARWETLLERLPTAVNLFRLFELRPGLLEQVLRVLTLARPLADELARRPALLDALIDSSALDLPGSVETIAARLAPPDATDSYEQRLDRIRRVVGEERFAMGVQLIEARHDPLAIAEGLARVAEAALQTAATAGIGEFEAIHGRVPGSELLVLGLGRLGGGALTHASDLDLIYLFTGESGRESNGRRPLSSALYFNRLAQRVTAALSVPTAEGALYEIDTRLRPQGNQGPLAVNLESFARYQQEDAWTWEHMALARARPVFGSSAARAEVTSLVQRALTTPRDPDALRSDVLAMRAEMAQHKQPKGLLDVKLQRGGLVDCEFIVHFLQLRSGQALVPSLLEAIEILARDEILPATMIGHYELLARTLIVTRLLAPDAAKPSLAAAETLARACGSDSFEALITALSGARSGVAQIWADIFGERLEIER